MFKLILILPQQNAGVEVLCQKLHSGINKMEFLSRVLNNLGQEAKNNHFAFILTNEGEITPKYLKSIVMINGSVKLFSTIEVENNFNSLFQELKLALETEFEKEISSVAIKATDEVVLNAVIAAL